MYRISTIKYPWCWVLVARTCNPSYLGGSDQEGRSSKPAQTNSSWDPASKTKQNKKPFTKIGLVECLKVKVLSSSPSTAYTYTHTHTHTHTQNECWLSIWSDKILEEILPHQYEPDSWAPVADAYNPTYLRQRSGESRFKGSPNKEFWRPYLKKSHYEIGLVEWLKLKALSPSPST
jgi:hypothetical protein